MEKALLTWSDSALNQSGKKAARELAEACSSSKMAARSVAVLEAVAQEKATKVSSGPGSNRL